MTEAKSYYLAYKTKSGILMFLGYKNNRPSEVGSRHQALKFKSVEEAQSYKKNMNVNDFYQVVEI